MKMIRILFIFALLSFTSHASNVNDFCVADLKGPDSPTGYHCKPPKTVTSHDFVFHLGPGNTSNVFKSAITSAFVKDFPAVNGLSLSVARIDIAQGGVVPMHTHPGANEIVMMVAGEINAGFITTDAVYQNTLKPGDVMVIPQAQIHFLVNSGKGNAIFYAAYSSANPRVQPISILLFGNNLSSNTVAQTTIIDDSEVRKLKAIFGGSG
ncbi:hypothetical protein JHK82_017480 [Glycine max]|uniref:auxin-binding protein ABP19b-like n=1 Tax=Glycine soja TaxID=3848 RepID=UPI00054A4EF1|nr:auxin-binding protein ABP19b-like [Glycine soja]KAG5008909.1 hypothetical protein JHK87_017424 [Glycine soja]KAG5141785.1 hypothetical protein JHK82_017480 [Glycine max]KHN01411.1 Germin-like protein subfamily 3 member 3 [Glycine soja]